MTKPNRGRGQPGSEGGSQGLGSEEGPPVDLPEGIFDRMQEDSYVLLKRRNPRTQQFEFVSRITPEETQEEIVQDRFGGGDYHFQERVRTAEGKFVFGRSRSIKILGEPKAVVLAPTAPATPGGPGVVEVTALQRAGGGNVQSIVEMGILQIFEGMQATQKMQAMVMAKALEANNRAPQNDKMMELLLQIVIGKQGDGNSSTEVMRLAKEIAELRDPKGGGGERRGIGDTLAELRELKEAAGLLGIGGEGGEAEDTWGSVARSFAPMIADALKHSNPARPRKALPPGGSGMNVIDVIRPAVPKLVETAKVGRDPLVYAQVAVDNMPASVQKPLREFLSQGREAALTKWWAAFPEATQYREWFIAYASQLAELLGVSWVAVVGNIIPTPTPPALPREDPSL